MKPTEKTIQRTANENGIYLTSDSLFFACEDGGRFVLFTQDTLNLMGFGSFLTHSEDWDFPMREGVVFATTEKEAAELLPQLEEAYMAYLADCIEREEAAEERQLSGRRFI